MLPETMTSEMYHTPVLLRESVDGLNIREAGGVWVDATFGGGGHSREILRRLDAVGGGRLFGIDQDADAEKNAMRDERFTFIRSNFRYLRNWMRYYGVEQVDGLLADLGLSSHHVDDAQRGFSFRADAPLDMRMNRCAPRTARDVVNGETEDGLTRIFRTYGEVAQARRVAAAIVKTRALGSVDTTGELLEIVEPFCKGAQQRKELAKIFQALRIEVNREMEVLRDMLGAAVELLRPGGRLVVISYHSLEDRMVKNMMHSGNVEGEKLTDLYGRTETPLRPVNRRVVTPTEEEKTRNPRARSARLRVAEKT